MDRESGIEIIREALADCLAVDAGEIKPHSRLVTDLGADSLDFVDLVFTLEKRFGVKVRSGEGDFFSRLGLTLEQAPQDEFLTPAAVDDLRPWLPALDEVDDPTRVTPGQVFSLITVETIWLLVAGKLAALPGRPG